MKVSALVLLPLLLFSQAVPAWNVALDPSAAGALGVHWTITLSAPYCGGNHIDDGVFIHPHAPLSLPDTLPADGVLFDGMPADAALESGVLRVRPSAALAQSIVCMPGERQFEIELLPALGMANPDAGDYIVDVWIGSGRTPVGLAVAVVDSTSSASNALATLDGQVLLGPRCPVVRLHDPAACADSPYQATLLVQSLDRPDQPPARVNSDVSGGFSVQLSPGRYEIRPQSPSGRPLPRGVPQTVTLDPGDHQTVTIHFDTGIR